TRSTAQNLPGGLPLLELDDPAVAAELAGQDGGGLPAVAGARGPAVRRSPPGSTGRGQGGGVAGRGAAVGGGQAGARVLGGCASASLSFDVSVFEIFGTLTAGGSIEIMPNLLALTSGPWCGSMISGVPTALEHVLAAPGTAARAAVVALCGEALTGQVVAAI